MTAAAYPRAALAPVGTHAGLAALHALFARLEADGVAYCHWKSNEHLGASMAGAADLDLLVAREAALPFARALAELGFKRFAAAPGTAYPGVEDYLGLDAATGALTHLHVHYELTLGERYIKGYRIPWERTLLERRVLDPTYGVWCADPAAELLLLLVRATLKLRWRDRLVAAGRGHALAPGMDREMRWLLERTDAGAVASLARDLLGAAAAALVPPMLAGDGATVRQLRALRRAIAGSLDAWRSYGAGNARARRWWRELGARMRPIRRRTGGGAPSRRVSPRGGVLVAFVGADGSGKSTLAGEIATWLGWKLDVMRTYGGSGVGSAGLTRRSLERGMALLRRLTGRRPSADRTDAPEDPSGERAAAVPVSAARLTWILALSHERRRRHGRARRARNRGMVVLFDRLPQSQFPRINDGPWLGDPAQQSSILARAAARYERDTFDAAERTAPDLVVRLQLPYDVAARRKSDTPPAQLRRKLEVVRRLRWPARTRVVDIDASRPLAEVLVDVKRAVWEAL